MTGAELRAARLALALTQAELARRIGVDVGTISRWERSQREAPPYLVLAIAHLSCRERSKP